MMLTNFWGFHGVIESSRAMVCVGKVSVCVKSLLKVHEHHVQRAVPFMRLFKDLAEDKDTFDA